MSQIIPKPWGQEEVLYIDDKYLMKRLTMNQGHRCSLQYHKKKNETVYVVEGELVVLIGKSVETLERKVLKCGEFLNIPPGMIHRMEGLSRAVYLEASTPEMEDVVRISDDYLRA